MKNWKHPKVITAAVVFLVSFLTYLSTIAPTTSFWDCGEFIASSYILGIPHPPGAPLYILIGRIFSVLPIASDIGLRVNIISALFSAFTAMFAFLIIVRLLEMWQGKAKTAEQKLIQYGSGVIGALAFAFSDSQWFNSVEAEVYAASVFFTAIVVWLILRWADQHEDPASDRWLVLIFYLVGLALGVHLLNLLALPTVFLIMYFQKRREITLESFAVFAFGASLAFLAIYPGVVKGIPQLLHKFSFIAVGLLFVAVAWLARNAIVNRKREMALGFISLFLILVGYSTYGIIFVRSSLNPAIDENDPDTPARFVSYLNREQYGDWSIVERRAPLWEYQIKKMYIRYFGWQFIGKGDTIGPDGLIQETISFRGLLGLPFLLGLIGMIHHFFRDWRRSFSILVLFIMTGIAIVIYLNQEDPQPRERDYAYTGSFFAFALWIGIGMSAILEYLQDVLKKAHKYRLPIMALTTLLVLVLVPGLMFAFNYDSHDRTGNYVAWDYSYNILQTCEPNAIIFTNGDNDTFPLWYLQTVEGIRPDVRVVNLSLLNTPWYIKQLRDFEPKVPIRLSDREIDRLGAMPWQKQRIQIDVPEEVHQEWVAKIKELDPNYKPPEKRGLSFELAPTLFGQGIRVQDIMIIHILSENKFRRPVYFAVTVADANKIGLHDYLRMDGLAFRVLPVKIDRRLIDPQILETNLFEKYQFRNLNNPDVYYNENIKALLGNYRSAFLTLAQYYITQNRNEDALRVLDQMTEIIPEEIIPPTDPNLAILIGQMYRSAGRPEELKKRLDFVIHRSDLQPEQKIQFLPWYADIAGDMMAAESLANEILKEKPDLAQAYGFLVSQYRRRGEYDKGIEVLQRWIAVDPNNSMARNLLQQLEAERQKASDSDSVKQP